MKRQTSVARYSAGVLLAMIGLPMGFMASAYCQDRPFSGPVTKTLPTSPRWFPTGNLNTARANHTATLLANGKVLVVGGRSPYVLDSAELYDPATGAWSVTGWLNIARSHHTATLLQNGKVLVSGGGDNDRLLNSAEVYDPATGTWSPTDSLAAAHAGHTATLLPNGKVLVSGGTDNFTVLHTAELYDPAAGTWGPAGSPTWARGGHTATLLQNGSVLVAGGIVGPYDADNEFPAASNAELYDPVADSWRNVGTAIRLYFHTATLLPNGKVLMAGGYSVRPCAPGCLAVTSRGAELYDPAGEAWSYTGNLSVERPSHTASLLPNGKVLVAGNDFSGGNHAELYDPDTGMWTSTSSLNAGRRDHTATLLPNGNVLVAGGSGAQDALNSAELYDPQTQTAVEYYYAAWNYYFVTSFPDEIAALDAGAFGGLWQRTGQTFNVWSLPTGLASPTCRFFSTTFAPKSSHFYTPFASECAAVQNDPNWHFESIAFYIQIPTGYGTGNGFCPEGTAALYRLYNNGMGGAPNHRYTTSLAIFNTMLAQEWLFEGEANTKIFACVPQ